MTNADDNPGNVTTKPGEVVIVVAVSENGVIGRDGGLPWKLPRDLRHFKAMTIGKPVIMGRRTFEEELGKPLPGRLNIVVTRQESWEADGALTSGSVESALRLAHEREPGVERCLIGGGQIYRLGMALTDRIELTRVHAEVPGDTRFDGPNPEEWRRVSHELVAADERNPHSMTFETWIRPNA